MRNVLPDSHFVCDECGKVDRKRTRGKCRSCWMREQRATHMATAPACSVNGCTKPTRLYSEWCEMHHDQMRRHGKIVAVVSRFREYAAPRVNRALKKAQLLESQGYACALCGDTELEDWHLDHDHECCGRSRMCESCVRGVLCRRCNVGLGMFDHDPERLTRAISYLRDGSTLEPFDFLKL